MSGDGPEDHARAGLEHLQAAAREVIQATRSLLDAADELVDDPSAVQDLVGTIATVAQAAAARLRAKDGASSADPGGQGSDAADPGGEPSSADDGRVQRIRLS
jgi:hypothetical protein